MATPTFQAVGTAAGTSGGAGDTIPAWPAHVAGDLGILAIETNGTDPAPSAPAGWTEAPRSPVTNAGNGVRLSLMYRFAAGASETNPTIPDPGNHCWAQILTVRGARTTDPFAASASTSGSAASWSMPGMSVTATNTLILHAVAWGLDNAGPLGGTITNNSGGLIESLTERYDGGTTDGDGGGLYVATGTMRPGALVPANSVSATNSIYAAISLAIAGADSVTSPLAPQWMGIGTPVNSATTDVTPGSMTTGGGVQVGDVEILLVETPAGVPAALSSAQGFVELATSPQDEGTQTRLTAYVREVTSIPTTAPTVTFSSDHVGAVIHCIRYCSRSGSPIDATVGTTSAAPGSNSVVLPGVTTTAPSCLIFHACADGQDNLTSNLSALANANLAALNVRSAARTTSGNGGGITVATGVAAGVGATGNTTATGPGNVPTAKITIALVGHLISLESGAVVAAGQALGVRVSRRIALEVSYGVIAAGEPLGLQIDRVFDPGAVVASGQAIGLTVSRRLALEAGAVAVAGQDVDLIVETGGAPVDPRALGTGYDDHVVIKLRNRTKL